MSIENEQTLATYDKTAQIYLDNTIAHDAARPEHAREKREKIYCQLIVIFWEESVA